MTLLEDKIANPLNFYKTPDEVDKDKALSSKDKVKILTSWLNDIILRETAEAENMPSRHNSQGHYVALIEALIRKHQ